MSLFLRYGNGTFPEQCQNEKCATSFNERIIEETIYNHGTILSVCKDEIFQGFLCPKCKWSNGTFIDINTPIINLNNFLLVPSSYPFFDTFEQNKLKLFCKDANSFLNFDVLPSEIPPDVSQNERDTILESIHNDYKFWKNSSTPEKITPLLFNTKQQTLKMLAKENKDNMIRLKRLYISNERVAIALSFLYMKEIFYHGMCEGFPILEISSGNTQKSLKILQQYLEMAPEDYIQKHLCDKGYKPDKNEIKRKISNILYRFRYINKKRIELLKETKGSEYALKSELLNMSKSFCSSIITEIAYSYKRNELHNCFNNLEKGKATFIDAPMGFGKTHSITEYLAINKDVSAIIFMPTNRLCIEIIGKLKNKIATEKKISVYEISSNEIFDIESIMNDVLTYNFKTLFLEKEVYFNDGINIDECIKYEKIENQYNKNWLFKKNVCCSCEKPESVNFFRRTRPDDSKNRFFRA